MLVAFIRGQSAATEGRVARRVARRARSASRPWVRARCMDFLFRNLKPGPHNIGEARADLYATTEICLKVLAVGKDQMLI